MLKKYGAPHCTTGRSQVVHCSFFVLSDGLLLRNISSFFLFLYFSCIHNAAVPFCRNNETRYQPCCVINFALSVLTVTSSTVAFTESF